MAIFSRKKEPKDTSALFGALTHGTYEQFTAIYDPATVQYRYSSGTLLTLALSNVDLTGRCAIAHRLLDDGAVVTSEQPLHVLLGGNHHDLENEPVLLKRMLDLGANVNEVSPGVGTPLETIAGRFKYSDQSLTPFYDVLLARPDIDLLQAGLDGRPVLVNIGKWYAKRADLYTRIEEIIGVQPPSNRAETP